MKEKELRLALVCYGGVSLAVYMHGLTKEIWKLLRASKQVTHEYKVSGRLPFDQEKKDDIFKDSNNDTETVYAQLLSAIHEEVHLRVIVDIVAGASAGGINSIFLAQAIAGNMTLEPLTKTWLEFADIEALLDDKRASTRWSKFYLRPLIWAFGYWQERQMNNQLLGSATPEIRKKLSRFVRSRWFHPPFSGDKFLNYIYEALQSLELKEGREALLPDGYPLDLFVTVTDYHGQIQTLRLHNPPEILEREHRMVISFSDNGVHGRQEGGRRYLGDHPSLAFAARATSSYPGAFPPAQVAEVDRMLAKRNRAWLERNDFLGRIFPDWVKGQLNLQSAALVDGSILNNKPFDEAIAALEDRPGYREVDRRIVYIDPCPVNIDQEVEKRHERKIPGFFSVLAAALSTIPRAQPIRDDLELLQERSNSMRRTQKVFKNTLDEIEELMRAEILPVINKEKEISAEKIALWRAHFHNRAAQQAGIANVPYAGMKIARTISDCCTFLAKLNPKLEAEEIEEKIWEWADQNTIPNIVASDENSNTHMLLEMSETPDKKLPPWITFLRRHDLSYRIRRLRFVLRRVNDLYHSSDHDHSQIDFVKTRLYNVLQPIISRREVDNYLFNAREHCQIDKFGVNQVMENLANMMDLITLDRRTANHLAHTLDQIEDEALSKAVLVNYLGFTFFDITVYPLLEGESWEEMEEIKVDRLSPSDSSCLGSIAENCLKGVEFKHFGAFFSRTWRENDYLWGRIHAAERMVDMLLSALNNPWQAERANHWKYRLILSILANERDHLKTITPLIDNISSEITKRMQSDSAPNIV